jgi:hypothetical protein
MTMRSLGKLVAVGAVLAGTFMGLSATAIAKNVESNIIGGPLVWMQQGTSNRNVVKMNKGAVQQSVYRPTGVNKATPMPLPRVR